MLLGFPSLCRHLLPGTVSLHYFLSRIIKFKEIYPLGGLQRKFRRLTSKIFLKAKLMLQLLKLAHSTKNHPKRKFFPGRCDCEQAPALSSEEEGFPAPHIPLSIQAFKYCRSPLTGLEVRGQGRSPLGVCIPAYSPIPFSFPLIDNSLSSRNNR